MGGAPEALRALASVKALTDDMKRQGWHQCYCGTWVYQKSRCDKCTRLLEAYGGR